MENLELRMDKDLFAAGGALCKRAGVTLKFPRIDQLTDRPPVAWLCRQLGVACSGF